MKLAMIHWSAGIRLTACVLLISGLLAGSNVAAQDATNYGSITKTATQQSLPGKFVWADLLTSDVEKAVVFYTGLLGWEFSFNDERTYAYATDNGEPVASIASYTEADDENAEAVWLLSISVDDIAVAQKAVPAAGGKVLEGPEKLQGRGEYLLVEDPRGALVMLLRSSTGDPVDDKDGWLWSELWTDDIDAATGFYQDVLGYKTVAVKGTDGFTHHVMGRDGKPRATVIQSPFEEVAPNWLPYVEVDDVEAVAVAVIKHGGKVLVPPQRDGTNYHVAIVEDSTGGVFAIQEQEADQ